MLCHELGVKVIYLGSSLTHKLHFAQDFPLEPELGFFGDCTKLYIVDRIAAQSQQDARFLGLTKFCLNLISFVSYCALIIAIVTKGCEKD